MCFNLPYWPFRSCISFIHCFLASFVGFILFNLMIINLILVLWWWCFQCMLLVWNMWKVLCCLCLYLSNIPLLSFPHFIFFISQIWNFHCFSSLLPKFIAVINNICFPAVLIGLHCKFLSDTKLLMWDALNTSKAVIVLLFFFFCFFSWWK